MANYVDFFRYSDGYEDVFIEGKRYLYACAEPFGRPYLLACNEYAVLDNGAALRFDTVGADAEYLAALDPAPADVAEAVIALESRRAARLLDECAA